MEIKELYRTSSIKYLCSESHPLVVFSPVSSTNKTDRHDITEILLKVVLNTIHQTKVNHLCGTSLELLCDTSRLSSVSTFSRRQ